MTYNFAASFGSNKQVPLTPVEKDIRSTFVHRLAHDAVEFGIGVFNPQDPGKQFMKLVTEHIVANAEVMAEAGFTQDCIERVLDIKTEDMAILIDNEIITRAIGEMDMFRMLKRFSGDGASGIKLEIVIERLAMMWEEERTKLETATGKSTN